eukprot:6177723-Pleurochrysis_carterae.AAC.1
MSKNERGRAGISEGEKKTEIGRWRGRQEKCRRTTCPRSEGRMINEKEGARGARRQAVWQ